MRCMCGLTRLRFMGNNVGARSSRVIGTTSILYIER